MSSHLRCRELSLHYGWLAVSFFTALSACAVGQDQSLAVDSTQKVLPAKLPIGEIVPKIGESTWIVFQDKHSNFWFGSDGEGVYRFNGKTTTKFSIKDGLCNDHIREIQQDKSGNVFFTTLDGVSKFDGQKFTTLTPVISNAADKGWKLQPDDLWFKGQPGKNGPYRFDGKSMYDLKFPKHYLEDGFTERHPQAPYSPYEIYTIYRDRSGSIWFGTSNFGVCRYDGESLSWMYEEHLTLVKGGGSFGIRSILEDHEGKFWICNTRNRFTVDPNETSEKGKGFISYTREKGIDSPRTPDGDDLIYYQSIIEDDRRDLWMVTYRSGVWRYDGKNLTQYPVKDGSNEITLFSISKDNHGELWLGTQKSGPYKFNGKSFEKFRP